jgi:UDP-galactopyranose mutase
MNILIVGTGFAGSVVAHELAKDGHTITIIDKRDHIGGNAYDYVNDKGIRVHKYGPHIFHTNSKQAANWITQFGEWVEYKHKVKAQLSTGEYVTIPINKTTKEIVGEENIIDTFYRPYTKKMWNKDIEELDPSILNRIPSRDDDNEYYFPNDKYNFMPKNGYTSIFKEILNHPNITYYLNTSYDKDMEYGFDYTFNSMPIDEYYGYIFGRLPYRSIRFHHIDIPMVKVLPTATVNNTNDSPYTRTTEWKNFPYHGINNHWTSLTYEEPCDYEDNNHERYYPVKDINRENRKRYERYKIIPSYNMEFIGRCGMYVYMDMHQAINSSLATVKRFRKRFK